MRELKDHVVAGDPAEQVTVTVRDAPGAGGAHHEYLIATPHDPEGIKQGCQIHFQNGPINEVGVNGVTHEALLSVILDRLRSFQAGPFASGFNSSALYHCEKALADLKSRTKDRLVRGVEGQNRS